MAQATVDPGQPDIHPNSPAHSSNKTNVVPTPGGLFSSSASSSADDDPICIVGMACRLPGHIYSPTGLWEFLMEKKTAMTPVHQQRFNLKGFYHAQGAGRAGTIAIEGGYFIQEDIRHFENGFFGINNLEATYMDPQQRKLLEVVYECLENAGVTKEQVSGTSTGVYVANFTSDFQVMQAKDPDYYHRYHPTGSGLAIMSNRVSHAFNLHGPSMTIDTACSSSFYALHHALTAINAGDCDQAIVAGANLIQSPEQHIGTAMGGFLSPTSTCHTFDVSADGYGRGEGVNAIIIKRLSAALRDRDHVYAVVRASAVNANGTTPGITLPDARLQAQVIRRAYDKVGLNPADTDYIECHGTGTPVGDPIEVEALSSCFHPRSSGEPPILIGSVKTNLGHSEAASGLTSIIKVAEAFEKGKIPPTRGVVNVNPKLQLEARTMRIVTDAEDWPRSIRRASINSFGYGGANGHLILESLDSFLGSTALTMAVPTRVIPATNGVEYESGPKTALQVENKIEEAGEDKEEHEELIVLPVSAASKKSLETRIQQITDLILKSESIKTVKNLAYTLGNRTGQLGFKQSLIAACKTRSAPNVLVQDSEPPAAKSSSTSAALPFAFVFTGQGAQYAEMGRDLLGNKSEVFCSTIRELDAVLRALPSQYAPGSWTLEQALLEPSSTSRVDEVVQSQPLCTAIQIGLVRMLRSWGIEPVATVGHSSGEIAAAYTAGLLTASQAILVAYFRGYAVGQLRVDGSRMGRMMAAALSPEAAAALIADKGVEGQVRVACVNAPESVTLSGLEDGIEKLRCDLQEQGIFYRKLETGGRAYHSHVMAEIGQLYEDLLTPHFKIKPHSGGQEAKSSVQMVSSVGEHAEALEAITFQTNMPLYWRRNLEQPVQFHAALANLVAMTGVNKNYRLIEIGPHPALRGPIKAIRTALQLDQATLPYHATLTRKKNASSCMRQLAGLLFVSGHKLDWAKVNNTDETIGRNRPTTAHVPLPPYPWDYSGNLLWNEPRTSVELRNRKYLRHELLGVLNVAGSGVDWSWRNVLRLSEMPWMQDHRLESQVVFPGAGYMATAIEAVCQASGLRDDENQEGFSESMATFEFRNVNIKAALVMQLDQPNRPAQELHTLMSRRSLSTATSSADWFDFSISSYSDGVTTRHCTGSIRVQAKSDVDPPASIIQGTVPPVDQENLDVWAVARWYEKSAEEGLCFGPYFQSLTSLATDPNRVSTNAVSKTRLNPSVANALESTSHYPMHPITIDACFQAAIMGGTAGNLRDLRSWLPVFVSECRIQAAAAKASSEMVDIHTRTFDTGVASRSIDCTVRRPEQGGAVAMDMKNVRLSLYTTGGSNLAETGADSGDANAGGSIDNVFLQRHPILRVHWKPDVSRLRVTAGAQLQSYVADHVKTRKSSGADDVDEGLAVVGALLDLVGHRNPSMRVLELGGSCACKKEQLLGLLDKESAFPRCRRWRGASLGGDKIDLVLEGEKGGLGSGEDDPFDAVVIPQKSSAKDLWENPARVQQMISITAEDGVIVTRETNAAVAALKAAGFSVMDVGKQTVLAVRQSSSIATTREALKDRRALILVPGKLGKPSTRAVEQLANAVSTHWQRHIGSSNQIRMVSLDQLSKDVEVSEKDVCISLLETECELLATISPEDLDRLRLVTDVVADLVWVTGSGMLSSAPNPDLTLSSGLSRALMMEQPALRFAVLDVGPIITDHPDSESGFLDAICENIERTLVRTHTNRDAEFVQKNGLLFVSRFGPDWDMNALFRRRMVRGDPDAIQKTPLASLGLARLSIGQVGITDTIHFQQISEPLPAPPSSGFVDVELKTVGLNAKDIYCLRGRIDTREGTIGADFGGIIAAVGPDVTHLAVGDRVVVWAPNHIRTIERMPVGCVHKLLPHEDLAVVPALLTVQATVLYSLRDRAQLRAGESVLIHAGAGAFGVAAIEYAQDIGATVYTTVGSEAKRDFLSREFGLPSSHIFNSRDASFVAGIAAATGGRGVDVIVNSLVGDLLHDSWRCLKDFGRFIEIGKRDLVDAGRLDMDIFERGCTFSAFDLSNLFNAEEKRYRDKWNSLMAEVLQLYRSEKIRPAPLTTFDVADISQAYRHFHNRDRLGKLVISMQDPTSRVPVAPALYRATFDASKVYLLAGCLGGLGRSLSRWMISRGARNFVFLGRSGCDKPSAQQLVSRLRNSGANVTVVRGDVVKFSDVQAAVQACRNTGLLIGGVVQAAMGLHEALFSRMSPAAWHTCIQPKWAGTWNLHNAIDGLDNALDFFLLTSSISGSVGTATESNYCAANGFLDAFARWRCAQGKPAVSVGLGMISEVGYLHENPDIEALLLRKGIQPLNEDEFLQVIDMALARPNSPAPEAEYAASHILTGLEPFSMRKLLAQGFDVSMGTMQDPRNAILAASLQAEQDAKDMKNKGAAGARAKLDLTAAVWLKDVPADAVATFVAEGDATSLGDAVLRLVTKRFSNLVLMPLDQVDDRKPLPHFGVDSMVAAEFRTWFWSAFRVDVSFLDIMSPQKSLASLAEFVEETLVNKWKVE